jgi:hypothetical protein
MSSGHAIACGKKMKIERHDKGRWGKNVLFVFYAPP